MRKIVIVLFLIILAAGIATQASDLVIDSKTQSYSEKDNKIKFDGDVTVSIDDMKVVGESADVSVKDNQLDVATFYDKPYAFEIKKNKKREVKANILKVSLINKIVRAEGDTQSIVYDGKTPIVVINADTQEYNTNTGIMTAEGTVTIVYKESESFSDKAVIKMDKNGDLQQMELIGNARIKEKNNDSFADYFKFESKTKVLSARGNTTSKVAMEDGQNLVLKSNFQEYAQDKSVYTASGDVRIWYQDYFAEGPKVTVYPDKTTNKPNEVYFSGRSAITQGLRTIYADKIKMIINPKDFHAEGNTRTVIRNIGSGSDENVGLGL